MRWTPGNARLGSNAVSTAGASPIGDLSEMNEITVRQNEAESLFEAEVPGGIAVIEYELEGDRIALIHTDVPKEAAGRGVGQALATFALDFARSNKLRVVPVCAYVQSYLKKHPDYDDIVDYV